MMDERDALFGDIKKKESIYNIYRKDVEGCRISFRFPISSLSFSQSSSRAADVRYRLVAPTLASTLKL